MPASGNSIGSAIGLQSKVDYSDNVNKLLDIQQKTIGARAKEWEGLKAKKQAQDEEWADMYNKISLKGVDEHWTPELKRRAADVITSISEQKTKDPYGYWINHPELKKKVKDLVFDIEDKQNKSKEFWKIRDAGAAGVIKGDLEETDNLKLFRENPDEYRKQMFALTGDSEAIIPDAFYKARIKPVNIGLLESQALKDIPTTEVIGETVRQVGQGKQVLQKYKTRDPEVLKVNAENLYDSTPYLQQLYPEKDTYVSQFVNSHKKQKSEEIVQAIPQADRQGWTYGGGKAENPNYTTSFNEKDRTAEVVIKPIKRDTELPDAQFKLAGVGHMGKLDRVIYDKKTGDLYAEIITKNEVNAKDENGNKIVLPDGSVKKETVEKIITVPYKGNEASVGAQVENFDFNKFIQANLSKGAPTQTKSNYTNVSKGKDSKGKTINIGVKDNKWYNVDTGKPL